MDTLLLDLFVPGKPEPQGSATAFIPLGKDGYPSVRFGQRRGPYKHGQIVVNVTSDNANLKGWRAAIADAAEEAWLGRDLLDEVSLAVECDFYLKRPEAHWGTGKNAHLLKDDQPAAPLTIPDCDKLLRAVLDGMTGSIYRDDSLVTACPPEKHYAVPDGSPHQGVGVRIRVYRRAVQLSQDLPIEQRTRVVPTATPAADADDGQLALA